MEQNNETMNWYLEQCSKKKDEYYGILLNTLKEYNINLRTATPQQACFVEEVARIEFERRQASRLGLPYSVIKPAFAS